MKSKNMKRKKLLKFIVGAFAAFTVLGGYAEAGERKVEVETFGESMMIGSWTVEGLGSPYSHYRFSNREKDLLVRLMTSEAAGEGDIGMYYVAEVVLNRVKSEEFPDTIEEVIFQKREDGLHQFCPLDVGTFWEVEPPEICYEILSDIETEYTEGTGALYFCENSHNKWHQNKEYLFTYKNHSFYK